MVIFASCANIRPFTGWNKPPSRSRPAMPVAEADTVKFSGQARPGFYSEKIGEAMAFAMDIHQSQARKGTPVPYFSHVIGVQSIMLEFAPIQGAHGNFVPPPDYLLETFRRPGHPDVDITLEDGVIAAILHDAIEDQGGTVMRQRIEEQFGPVVAMLVDYCTDYENTPARSYNERKIAYLKRVVDEAPETALLISASDKLHNMRTMLRECRQEGEAFWGRFKPLKEEKLQYNRDIVRIYGGSGKFPELMDEIAYTHKEIETVALQGLKRWQAFWKLMKSG